jgi:hypothetical protein
MKTNPNFSKASFDKIFHRFYIVIGHFFGFFYPKCIFGRKVEYKFYANPLDILLELLQKNREISETVLLLYLPSIGEIALSVVSDIVL